ncbi:unnamed protein product [Symbiodinium sp. CCMP2592]|nr:unnamed protein product [Symbiodinium sp. CCMP2592]
MATCGTPELQDADGLGNVLAGDQDSADERDEKDNEWKNLQKFSVGHMLDNDLDVMTFYDKEKPGAFIPMISFGRPFTDVRPQPEFEVIRLDLEEEHDVGLARKFAFSSRGRSLNAEKMMNVNTALIPPSRKGSCSAEQEEAKTKYETLIRKLKSHEESLKKLVSSQNRRLTGKKSVEEHEMDPGNPDMSSASSWNSMTHSRTASYHYSDKQEYSLSRTDIQLWAERNPCPVDFSVMLWAVPRWIWTYNLDIYNCCLTSVQQIIIKTKPEPSLPDDLMSLLDDVVKNRSGFIKRLGLNVVQGKNVINCIKRWNASRKLEESRACARLAETFSVHQMDLLHQDYMSFGDNKQETFPSERIGFSAIITVKQHMSFIELVKSRDSHANALSNVPPPLLEEGNCIPCALWHVVPLSRPTTVAVLSGGSLTSAEALKLKYRDYRSMASMCSIDLTCCFGLLDNHVKSYMTHYEGNGSPHCVAVRLDASGSHATLFDGATVYKMSMLLLSEIHDAAVDHSTIVSYWKREARDKPDEKAALLLDMAAGADSDGSDERDSDDVKPKFTLDEDDSPVISDGIKTLLSEEVKTVSEELRSFAQLRQLQTHIEKHHAVENQYVRSGSFEWHNVSMDGTVKVCLKLLGQETYTAPKTVRDAAPFGDGDNTAWRRILTVRGRSGPGAVLLLRPLQNESSEQLAEAFTETFSADQLGMICHVATDGPSEKLYTQMKAICPKLESLMLDPVHVAIVYEYGFWNKKSSGSKQLRRILNKCVANDPDTDVGHWSTYYDGTTPRPLNCEETRYREMILNFPMIQHEAASQLDGLRLDIPFYDRAVRVKGAVLATTDMGKTAQGAIVMGADRAIVTVTVTGQQLATGRRRTSDVVAG